jgi:hypothetical protein
MIEFRYREVNSMKTFSNQTLPLCVSFKLICIIHLSYTDACVAERSVSGRRVIADSSAALLSQSLYLIRRLKANTVVHTQWARLIQRCR